MVRTADKKSAASKRSGSKKKIVLEFRWDGAGEKHMTYYQAVTHGEDIFSVGDVVELCAGGRQPPLTGDYKKSWVAEIEALWEDENGEKWMENRWYYATNDIAASSRPPYRKRELFETDHISNNPIEAISQKVSILSHGDWDKLNETEQDSCFFCENFYSPKTTYLHPIYDSGEKKKVDRIHLYSLRSTSQKRPEPSSGKIAPSSRSRSKRKISPKDFLERAKEHLMLSFVPSHIPCREKERSDIYNYLYNSIQQKGNGSPLYISGMPGTGKTATVREVVRELREKLDFNYLEINGMKVTSATSAFSMILNFLTRKYVIPSKAADVLNDYFTKPKRKNNRVLVLLADELDFLFTKNQQVIYKLFDWPSDPHSQLIVIVVLTIINHMQGISNTIDLPERIMNLRNISRLSMNRVMFKPYTRDQITTIINNRLEELDVFTSEAIDLCSRKVSAVSGDVRRALTIARRAIEIAENQNLSRVPISAVSEAAKEHAESYKISLLQHCSLYQMLLLISIVLHMNAIGVDFVLVTDIYPRMATLVSRYREKELLFPELQAVVASLSEVGIISVIPPSTKFDTMLKLNIQPDDICFALKDDEIAKKELSLLM